jgi:protein-S-isoprenylcysteine O-methyltransferase Ste14
MSFQASEGEFRNRAWIIGGIIWAGFLVYAIDRVNTAQALSRFALGGHPGENSAAFGHWITGFFWFATLMVAIGAWIRSWAEAYLHSSIVFDRDLHGERLVAEGPYRYVRNPLYLGNLFLAVGLGFLASRSGFFIISVGMLIFVYRLILREEATLLESQGESYQRYLAAVPRLFPALIPRVPASDAKPNWLDGFTGEVFMWGTVAGMAAFTATRHIRWFWIALGASWTIHFLKLSLRSRQLSSAKRNSSS